MTARIRSLGDEVWIFVGNHRGEMTKGTIVHVFEYGTMQRYVIAIPTGIDDILEVREGPTIADGPRKPIGMWKTLRLKQVEKNDALRS